MNGIYSTFAIFFIAVSTCTCSGCEKHMTDGKKYLIQKNRLRYGEWTLRKNVFLEDEINLAFQDGFFSQKALLLDIDIKSGNIEILCQNGKIILYPQKQFSVVCETPKGFLKTVKLKLFRGFEIDKNGIAPFWNSNLFYTTESQDRFETTLASYGLGDTSSQHSFRMITNSHIAGRYHFVTLSLKKSPDFTGSARLVANDNFYNDSCKPGAFLKIFYNP